MLTPAPSPRAGSFPWRVRSAAWSSTSSSAGSWVRLPGGGFRIPMRRRGPRCFMPSGLAVSGGSRPPKRDDPWMRGATGQRRGSFATAGRRRNTAHFPASWKRVASMASSSVPGVGGLSTQPPPFEAGGRAYHRRADSAPGVPVAWWPVPGGGTRSGRRSGRISLHEKGPGALPASPAQREGGCHEQPPA